MTEQIRGKTVVQKLTPGAHASTVAVVEGGAVVRVAHPSDPTQSQWPIRARAARELEHPSLVRPKGAAGADVDKGLPAFVAHEHIEGPTVGEFVQVPGVLTESECARIVGSLAEALSVLHGAGIAHGRVHVDQVRLRSDLTPVLLDVGATWGEADPTPERDIEDLITLAEQLPETPRLSALVSLRGTGASADEFLSVLNGAAPPADLVAAAFDHVDDIPALTAPSVPTPVDDDDLPALAAPSAPTPVEDVDEGQDEATTLMDPYLSEPLYAPSAPSAPAPDGPAYDGSFDPTAVDEAPPGGQGANPHLSTPVEPVVTAPADERIALSAPDVPVEPVAEVIAVEPSPAEPEVEPVVLAAPDIPTYDVTVTPVEPSPEDVDFSVLEAPTVEPDPSLEAPAAEPEPVAELAPGLESAAPAPVPVVEPDLGVETVSAAEPAAELATDKAHDGGFLERAPYAPELVTGPATGESPAAMAAELATALAARDALSRQVSDSAVREQRLEADLVLARAQAQQASVHAAEATARAESAQATVDKAQARITELEDQLSRALAAHAEASEQFERTSPDRVHLAALEAATRSNDEQIAQLTTELAQARIALADAQAEVQFHRDRNAALSEQVNQDAARIVELTAALDTALASSGQSEVWEQERVALVERAELAEGQVRTLTAHIEEITSAEPAPTPVVEQVVVSDQSELIARLTAERDELAERAQGLQSLTLDLSKRLSGAAPGDDPQVPLLRAQVESLTSQLASVQESSEQTISDLRAELEALRTRTASAAAPTGGVLPVTPAPQRPTVAVVEPLASAAGPELVRALDELKTRAANAASAASPQTPPAPDDV